MDMFEQIREKKYQKMLVLLIVDKGGELRSQEYMHPEILRDIMTWGDEEAERVWEIIKWAVNQGMSRLASSTCPFCVRHYFLLSCENICKFRQVHDHCLKENSFIKKLPTEKIKQLTNEWYRETVSNITNLFKEVETEV